MLQPASHGGWVVGLGGDTVVADSVVLAIPAPRAADLVDGISSGGARVLRDVPYSPVSTVHLTYPRAAVQHPLDGFGMLIPSGERRPVLGILWISSLFPGRGRDGLVQTTSFVGGARFPELAGLPESELVELVHGEHRRILGASVEPSLRYVARWTHAIPRMEFGHVDRLATLERMEGANPGIHLAGSYGSKGPSVPACWARGRAVADTILAGRRAGPTEVARPDR
jgi:oxygen-dependent protoporphyrinogen oxidase